MSQLDARIKEESERAERLRGRRNLIVVYGLAAALSAGVLVWLAVLVVRYRREAKALKMVMTARSTSDLCHIVRTLGYSERVRRAALSRLDKLGVVQQTDLDAVEVLVGELYSSAQLVDRTLAVEAAGVTRALSNRLRHRIAG
jgi:hypothetical protein